MAVQTTQTPKGYTPGNVAQAQDAAVFERSGAGVYLTIEWIATYIQTALGNGSAISFGTTNPANTVGEQDDVFFNIGTGEVLSKGASTWSTQANFALDTEVTAAIAAAITAHSGATDPHPTYLTQAEATALYKPLTTDDSVATGLRFALKTVTTGTPANGEIQFNNATLASVTSLLIAETGRDGSAIANLLDLLQQSTRMIIQVEQSEGLYAWFNITGAPTDSGTYRTVPVSFVTAPTGITTVTGLGAAGAELTLNFYGVGGGSGVGSGLKFQYNSTVTLPAQSKQFRANAATPETATSLSFSVTEDQSNSPNVSTILARLKANAIIEVRQTATSYYRYNCTTDAVLDASVTPNAYTISVSVLSSGVDTAVAGAVYLTIISDAPAVSTGGSGFSGGAISLGTVDATTAQILSLATASNGAAPYTYSWYRSTAANVLGTLIAGATGATLSDSGLSADTTIYYYRRVATDLLTMKATTNQLATTLVSGATLNGLFISWWKMNETSGNRIDTIGGNNLAPVSGTPSSVTGLIGNAVGFAGTADATAAQTCLEVASNASLSAGSGVNLYVTCAVKMNSLTGTHYIVSKYNSDTGPNAEWTFYVDNSRFNFDVYNRAASSYVGVIANNLGAISINIWYIVQMWYDATAQTVNISVNNGAINSSSASSGFNAQATGAAFRVGALYSDYRYGMNGSVDCLGFSKTIPSAAQRTLVYNNGAGVNDPTV